MIALVFVAPVRANPRATTQALPTSQPVPHAALEQMYKLELGKSYDPASFDKLHQAHQLLEEYFNKPERRADIVRALEGTVIDPNILGRLVRIRINWPDLKGGVYYINEKLGPHNVHYFLGLPKGYDRTRPWPLVIKLPAADAFVVDPMPDADRVRDIYTGWMTEELTKHPDAIVIMPLLNLDELWGPSYPGMHSVIQPLLHAAERVNIDPARVHLMGHSMSGHAVWNLALHYPTYFSSFCAMAGGASMSWQRIRVMNLRNLLAVAWHDADDDVIKVDSSRRLVRLLKQLKVPVEYEETKKLGHVPPQTIVDKCYERMRGKARELYPKHVSIQSNRPDTMFNRNDWVQIYQPLNMGEEKRIYFQRGSGFMIEHPTQWKIEATLTNNRIDATAGNVESMRFYLNDQMVDFSKPVTVNINRKGRFEGIVKPGIDIMLKDQLFLGRGWRYYTAVVDVDFGPPPSTRPTTQTTRPAGATR